MAILLSQPASLRGSRLTLGAWLWAGLVVTTRFTSQLTTDLTVPLMTSVVDSPEALAASGLLYLDPDYGQVRRVRILKRSKDPFQSFALSFSLMSLGYSIWFIESEQLTSNFFILNHSLQ